MKKYYNEITVTGDPNYIDLLGEMIVSITDEAVEIGGDRVIIRTEKNADEIIETIERAIEQFDISISLKIESRRKENMDWIEKYKESVQPIEAGVFYVHPEWHDPSPEKTNILINPALAFGSGHHATTYSCLEAVGEYVKKDDTVLDVGCGSGILALAASKMGATADICDTDPLALQSAEENFALNARKWRRSWVGSAHECGESYDVVIANIIADVLKAISAQLISRVRPGGILILSGILDKKESIVTDSFKDLKLIRRKHKDEWITLVYKKDVNGQSTEQ